MNVVSLSAQAVVVPVERPLAFSTRFVAERHYCIVRVALEGGVTGYGFCYAGNSGGALVAAAAGMLAGHVVGQDPRRTEAIWDAMFRDSLLLGRRGAVLRAISAIDIALWDAVGKATDAPLWLMLGGHRKQVPAYASGGYYYPGKGARGVQAEVAGWRKAGYRDAKIKVGRGSVREDAARVAAARKALGPDGRLFLDANNAWADVASALAFCEAVEEHGIGWIEEPFMPDNIRGHAELAQRTSIPVATGEIHQTRWDFQAILEQRAADILQVDAAVCGGITEFMRIAQMAAGFDVPVAPHWFSDLHVSLVAAVPNGMIVEHFPTTEILNFMELIDDPVQAKNGMLAPKDLPGHGIRFNERKIARFAAAGGNSGAKPRRR